LLDDEARQHLVECTHYLRIAIDYERTMFGNRAQTVLFDIAGDDAGKRAAQIRRKQMPWLLTV